MCTYIISVKYVGRVENLRQFLDQFHSALMRIVIIDADIVKQQKILLHSAI